MVFGGVMARPAGAGAGADATAGCMVSAWVSFCFSLIFCIRCSRNGAIFSSFFLYVSSASFLTGGSSPFLASSSSCAIRLWYVLYVLIICIYWLPSGALLMRVSDDGSPDADDPSDWGMMLEGREGRDGVDKF